MKWIALPAALSLCLFLPVFIKQRPELNRLVWTAFGLLPFLLSPLHLYMALRSWPAWPGYVKGIEVTLLDLLAIGLFFSLTSRNQPLPFKIPMLLYAAAVLLSCFQSESFEISFAYLVQIGRMFLIYAIVAKASVDEQISDALFRGLAIGIGLQAVVVIFQRFGLGELQATGTFGHQNSLGLSSHFVTFPFFALFLYQRGGWFGGTSATLAACVVVVMLTVSRATIGLTGLGFIIVFAMSAARNWTSRKALVGAVSFCVALFLLPVALTSFSARTNIELEKEYDERAAFKNAAASVVADHPLGVGANNYVVVVNTQGYNERAGVASTFTSLSAHVHNVYYLVAAETGWIGLATYLFVLAGPPIYAFRNSHRFRNSRQGQLLLGLCVSLLIVILHSLYEWTFIDFSLQYLGAVSFGLVVGISQQARATHRQNTSRKSVHSHTSPRRADSDNRLLQGS